MRVEQIGIATLYLGDCREILPTLPSVDAVITDPPYGQAYKVNTFYKGGSRESSVVQRNGKTLNVLPNLHAEIDGDDAPFDPSHLLDLAPTVLIWGAHKFGHLLPQGRTLVWDKVPTGKLRSQGDGETAWTNVNPNGPLRVFRLLWDGLCVGDGARHEVTAGQKRLHPMQKPEILMRWCIEQAGYPRRLVDPYMGSGSTGIAAVQAGCEAFYGIESQVSYFDIACRRIETAQRQQHLFPIEIESLAHPDHKDGGA
ncbi:DNA methyltransferase [Achromobacter sp. UBA4530]|uniref:DNA methyltransferase n=1 Tax=Achromobacter sp. UBA4530 TaxID=1945912 RepID=UPI002580A716|nr:DNA methyltransferase [Achromobacter sp. UBA4530]